MYCPLLVTLALLIASVWFKFVGVNVMSCNDEILAPLNIHATTISLGVGIQSIWIDWLSKVIILLAVACSSGTVYVMEYVLLMMAVIHIYNALTSSHIVVSLIRNFSINARADVQSSIIKLNWSYCQCR